MSLIQHAETEMKIAFDMEGELDKAVYSNVMDIIKVFADQGHSGTSAPFVTDICNKLMRYQPLGPLTGADVEWVDNGGGDYLQNKRRSSVFKHMESGECHDIDGFVYWRWETDERTGERYKFSFTGGGMPFKKITFPYTPSTEYVEAPPHEGEET